MRQVAIPYEVCICPDEKCIGILLTEDEVEEWDDETCEGDNLTRSIQCPVCGRFVLVTIEPT